MWSHRFATTDDTAAWVSTDGCAFCDTPLVRDKKEEALLAQWDPAPFYSTSMDYEGFMHLGATVGVCPTCGWWKYLREFDVCCRETGRRDVYVGGGVGVLLPLDLADISTPLDEVKRYLTIRYGERLNLAPSAFEHIVGDVFRHEGYDVVVVGRSGDGGIDVVLTDSTGETIGVQVKRYKNRIEAEQIRAFVGALVLRGHTRGVYVTTSDYRRGARTEASIASARGVPVNLVNATEFYERLKLSARDLKSPPTVKPPWEHHKSRLLKVRLAASIP